ncbi:uncharacterized protein ACBR49_003713 [Aulostomus maculatus]
MHFMFSLCFSFAVSSPSSSSSCRLQGQFHLNGMHEAGDVVLGGLFGIHFFSDFPDLHFTSGPQQPTCYGFDVLGFRHAQAMAFATNEINRNSNLLPNVTLGYTLYDNCVKLGIGFRAALSLASGQEEQFTLEKTCEGAPPVLGIVGDASSTRTIAISSVLGLYRVPVVSYYATCACLSNRAKFPSFFRTIPSDAFQVRALIQILNRFRWIWVGLLVTGDDYGLHAAQTLQSDLAKSGEACLAYLEVLPWGEDPDELSRIVGVMKESTARVVIAFAHESQMIHLLKEVIRQNVTGLQWLASEAWSTAAVLQTPRFMPYLGGTLGIAIRRGEIPGLKEFLLRIRPDKHHNISYGNNMVNQFWEHTFQCRFAPPPAGWLEAGGALCTGDEQLENVETEFLDVSNLRPEYNVYKAVYALAHALDDMLQCVPGRGPFSGSSCATLQRLEPWQLVYYLQKINFTTPFGDQVLFDENGDVVPIYDVMNWLWLPDGGIKVQNVGEVKKSVFKGEELTLNESKIFWNFQPKEPPRSVCSESCPPGTRMARKKGEPECCFDCIPCSDGNISNNTDSLECTICPDDLWSNLQRDNCIPKKTEFLSYHEPLGICLTTASLLGTLISAVVLGIFICNQGTPIVRTNNSELSFLLLVSLKLCFLCSLLFIGRPRLWTCQLRHAAFGISFVLCVSCILVKTMVVLAVFKASKPGGGASLKWFGALQQRGTVLGLTSIQAAICTTWLVSASPSPHKNTQYHNDKIVYECVVGSTVGFAVLLGYIGLLAILSFLLAFLARNLPDNFNEAKFITFSMLIFCAVWVAFVPAYVNSPGKYADAVEVFAILASSFGLLVALFGPKCYIILLRPERNTKKAVMGRGITSTRPQFRDISVTNFTAVWTVVSLIAVCCHPRLWKGRIRYEAVFKSSKPGGRSNMKWLGAMQLQGQFYLSGIHEAGDVVLGGLFAVHFFSAFPDLTFTSKPQQPTCHGLDVQGFRQAQTMVFAIKELNRNSNLLPDVTLGFSLYDTCDKGIGFRAGLSSVSGREEQFTLNETCVGTPPVLGIVGDSSSTQSIAISSVVSLYRVPMVSYFSTCACLSNRQKFPSFFRTIPSDAFQVRALIQILNRFRWTWVGLLVSDDDYGLHAARSFQSDLAKSGAACLAYLEVLSPVYNPDDLSRIVEAMKKSTAQVVIVFAPESHVIRLLEEVIRQNVTGLQWLASEAWTTATVLQTPRFMPYLGGTLGIAIRRGEIPGLKEFLLRIRPDKHHNISYGNNMVNQFWEHTFQCRFAPPPAGWLEAGGALCTGDEQLENVETEFLDVSNLRPEYNVYKAVYALAYALDDMLQCVPGRGPFSGSSCATLQRLEPWQLVYYLQKINFTTSFGDQVSFDENGDALPIYDVMNWLWLPDGRAKVQNVGEVKETVFKGGELTLDENKIFWNFQTKQPPRSVCSVSCPPGTRMARKKGEPECCFNCIPCSDGKFSNKTDSTECISCPDDFWSSPQRNGCVPKKTEFLSYHEPLGICLTTSSLLGTFICSVVLGIFIYHRSTPVVRANNSELSFQLLISLKFCFLCSLLFIGRPRLWTCQLRHAAFGISFVLCVSCILVKTMVVLAVFKASKPGGGASLKWFGAMQQRGMVLGLTSIQAAICTTWLVSASPSPHKNTQYHNDKIVYECVVGSTVGFAVLLGYIGLLAILSFLLAFLARNLPDNFNEAKFITFSMLIFCAVWVAFVPAYVNSPGKYADAVEVFAILASSFGLLVALFGPKCYIILLRPERNTKKAIMGNSMMK